MQHSFFIETSTKYVLLVPQTQTAFSAAPCCVARGADVRTSKRGVAAIDNIYMHLAARETWLVLGNRATTHCKTPTNVCMQYVDVDYLLIYCKNIFRASEYKTNSM